MMKKTLISLVGLALLLVAASPSLIGFSLLSLGHALQVSTAMSAKLACSAYFISGFEPKRIVEDLASYSPTIKMVNIDYDDQAKLVSADLYGLASSKAKYRDGLGCALLLDNGVALDHIKVAKLEASTEAWPAGEYVDSINPKIQAQLEQIVAADEQQGLDTRAMLVVKDGNIVAEAYGENETPTSVLLGWSMAKSLTAIMLARMEQMGLISRSDAQLFDSWQHDKRRELTLEQLLQMSSGLAFDETYQPGYDATRMLFTAASASDVAMKSPLAHEPGSFNSYSSGTTNLLARYIHQQLGNSTQANVDFVYQQIFKPLGMAHSTLETDASGVFVGSSYLYASGRDWARLGLLMLNDGKVGDQQLLPVGWAAKAAKPNHSDNDKRYGYQFWLNAGEDELRWPLLPPDAYAMLGNRKQSVMIVPSANTVLVRLGWSKDDYPMGEHYSQLLGLLL